MPFYVYRHTDARGPDCSEEFEATQGIREDAFARCPVCGEAVSRVPQTFISRTDPLAPSKLKNSGFTKLTRRDKGVYEAS